MLVLKTRSSLEALLDGSSDKLLVLAGPPLVTSTFSCVEYAARLASLAAETADELVVLMRVDFAKSFAKPGLLKVGRQMRTHACPCLPGHARAPAIPAMQMRALQAM